MPPQRLNLEGTPLLVRNPNPRVSSLKRARVTSDDSATQRLAKRLDNAMHAERNEALMWLARQIARRGVEVADDLRALKALMEELPSEDAQSLVLAIMVDEGYSTQAMATFCNQFPGSCQFRVLFDVVESVAGDNAVLRHRMTDDQALLALKNAARMGDSIRVRFLLGAGAKLNYAAPAYAPAYSALEEASLHGHADIVTLLVDARASPTMHVHRLALLLAAPRGHEDVVSVLLRAGADPNFFFNLQTPLERASAHGHSTIVRRLLAARANVHDNRDQALISSIRADSRTVRILLSARADVHARNDYALKTASHLGYANIVALLLNGGADVHADSDASLTIASEAGNAEVVTLLLNAGANLHARHGRYVADAPLTAASRHGHANVVTLLLSAGANVHANRDEPLMTASRLGHAAVVRLLLDANANPRERTDAALRYALDRLRDPDPILRITDADRQIVRMLRDAGSRVGSYRHVPWWT